MLKRIFIFYAFFNLVSYQLVFAQCLTPIGSDTALCTPGTPLLNVNGTNGFYTWYNSSSGPSFLDTGNVFQSPLVSLRDTFYVSEFDTGATSSELLFDGSNDYAAIRDFNYNTSGLTGVTIEVWINTTNSANQVIASFDRTEYWRLEINGSGAGPGQIGFDIATNTGVLDFGSVSRVDDGLWHHVAAVFDNGAVSIYIDGNLDASTSQGATFGTGLDRFGFLGTGSEAAVFDGSQGPSNYFDGEMSNFRIWSAARTQAEIQQSMNNCLIGVQSNLEINYLMNGSSPDNHLIDYSGNQRSALMRNFPLPGAWGTGGPSLFSCLQCESARDTVTVQVVSSSGNVLGNDTCIVGDSLVLDAGPGYLSYLWQDNSTFQTFTAYNSGLYSITVDTTINACEIRDSITVFINPIPTGVDTSFCGEGNYQLRATGSNGFYKWYDSFNSTAPVDTGKLDFTLNQTDTFYVAAYDTLSKFNALDFEPASSNYASILGYSYSGTNYTELTVQSWIKTSDGDDQMIASFDRSEYWRLEVNGNGGSFGTIGFDLATDAGIFDFGGSIRIDDGLWHHIAAVFDNGTVSIYVDGVLDNSGSQGSSFGTGPTRFGFIGTGSEASTEDGVTGPNDYFNGSIADFSIYHRALSQAEIQTSLNNCKIGGENGLEIYYPFTEGEGAFLNDRSGNNRNAVLKNSFANNAWNENGPILQACASDCESERDTVIALLNITPRPDLGPDICASVPTIIDAGPNYSSYLWNTTETTQTITTNEINEGQFFVTVDSAGTPCSGSDTIFSNIILVPSGEDSSRCGPGDLQLEVSGASNYRWRNKFGTTLSNSDSLPLNATSTDTFLVSAIECDTLNQALTFDGTNDYVALDMFYNSPGQIPALTVEAWVKTTFNTAGSNDNWAIVDFDRSEYYNLYVLGDGRVGFSTEPTAGSIDDFYSSTTLRVNDGNWHHIAAVYDGTDKFIYIDGNLINTRLNPHGGSNLGNGTTRYGYIGDGSESGAFNAGRNGIHYEGDIAEVRIWSIARTADQIRENIQFCIEGGEPGLEAYYKMDDGPGTTNLIDHSGNDHHGTLFNMDPNTAWINTNNDIFCNCCESDPDTVVAVVFNAIDSTNIIVSCPSIDSSTVLIDPFGGSGIFDYRELSGEFAYSNNFVAGESRRSLENGGTYQIEVSDDNGCLDTTNSMVINPTPTAIASSTSSASCRIIDQNKFSFIVNASNEVILGVRSPSEELGVVNSTVYLSPNALVYNGEAYLNRHFLIASDSVINNSVDLRFPLLAAELSDLIDSANSTIEVDDDLSSIAELGVTRYNGPTEDGIYDPSDASSLVFLNQLANGSQFGVNYFEVSTNSFSEFWPHASNSNRPLPIELKSFDVSSYRQSEVLIQWSTYSEVNNNYFTVEKTSDGRNWIEVGVLKGQGNSTAVNHYQLVDAEPFFGKSFYRLKQTDFDGRFEFFEPKAIDLIQNGITLSVYPNPTDGRIYLDLSLLGRSGQLKLQIHSTEGKLVYNSHNFISSSDSEDQFFFDLGHLLDDGVYILSLSTSKEVLTTKLIVNK